MNYHKMIIAQMKLKNILLQGEIEQDKRMKERKRDLL